MENCCTGRGWYIGDHFSSDLMNNTYIKMGLYKPCIFINPDDDDDEELLSATVYIDEEKVQILNENGEFIAQFFYEELRGIMAVMAAHQEKQSIRISAIAKKN